KAPRDTAHHPVPPDPHRNAIERLSERWPRHALARLGLVARPVRRALHEAPVLGEELVLDPVEAHGHVPAAVQVGVVRAAVVQEEALDLAPVAAQPELLRLAAAALADPRDGDAHARTTRR